MIVPAIEEQAWAPVWAKVQPSLRWDPVVIQRLSLNVPTPAPTQPVAPTDTPDLDACLSSCDIYTDPSQWYQCVSGCSSPLPTDVPLPPPDPCVDSCMVYTTRNEFQDCLLKCLPNLTPLPTKSRPDVELCRQGCGNAFESCLDGYGSISAPVASMSCIVTCEATSAGCNVNCDW